MTTDPLADITAVLLILGVFGLLLALPEAINELWERFK